MIRKGELRKEGIRAPATKGGSLSMQAGRKGRKITFTWETLRN
jgi:hypothetical protein